MDTVTTDIKNFLYMHLHTYLLWTLCWCTEQANWRPECQQPQMSQQKPRRCSSGITWNDQRMKPPRTEWTQQCITNYIQTDNWQITTITQQTPETIQNQEKINSDQTNNQQKDHLNTPPNLQQNTQANNSTTQAEHNNTRRSSHQQDNAATLTTDTQCQSITDSKKKQKMGPSDSYKRTSHHPDTTSKHWRNQYDRDWIHQAGGNAKLHQQCRSGHLHNYCLQCWLETCTSTLIPNQANLLLVGKQPSGV